MIGWKGERMADADSAPEPEDGGIHMLRAYLSDRDEACPSCRYNLRGLDGRHCPECGQTLMLRVGLESPNMAAFIVGLVALASALGFNALMFIFFLLLPLVMGRGRSSSPEMPLWLTVTGIGVLISVPGLLIWVRQGGRIRRMEARSRWAWAFLLWFVPVASLGAFLLAAIHR